MSDVEGHSYGIETNFAAQVELREKRTYDSTLIHECELVEKILEVDSCFLEDTHPAVVYLQERIDILFPKETLKVRVSLSENEPNAVSFAHGVIIVTKGLLDLLETQDEVDFVLAHEAVHYVRGHVFEIKEVIDQTKKSFSPQKMISDEIKILGAKRFAEYEADIRGLLAQTEGGVNPVAARNVFLKLDEYKKRVGTGTSVDHGSNILRMVNIGTLVSLYDTTSSVAEQTPLPDFVKEVGRAKIEKGLLTKLDELSELKKIPVLVEKATFFELCITLHKTLYKRRVIDKDIHKRRQSENYQVFEKAATESMLRTIRSTFPELSPQDHEALLQSVLTMVVGIENHSYTKANYNKYIKTFESDFELVDMEHLQSVVSVENFEKLGLVIPEGDGVAQYFENFRLAATENELFTNENGEFDRQLFFAFFTKAYTHFNELAKKLGFHPLDKNELAEWAFKEILLNLNIKKIKDKSAVIQDIIREFAKERMLIDIFAVKEILAQQAHLSLDEKDIEQIEEIFGEVDPKYRIWQKLFTKNTEHTEVKYSGDRIKKIARKNLSSSEIIEIADVKNVEELKSFVLWVLSYAKEQALWEVEEIMSKFFGELARGGASFLPLNREERYEILLFVSQQVSKEIGTDFWNIFILDEVLRESRFSEERSSKEQLELLHGIIKVIDGTHSLYKDGKFSPADFNPSDVRSSNISDDEEDKNYSQEDISHFIGYRFLDAIVAIYRYETEKISKEELLYHFKHVIDFIFQYHDIFPSSQGNPQCLEYIFSEHSFSLSDISDQQLLLYISVLISDPGLRERFQQVLLPKLYEGKNFDEKLHILFQEPLTRGSVNKDEREKFVEQEVKVTLQAEKVKDAVLDQVDSYMNYEKVGKVAIVEFLYQILPPATRVLQKQKLFSLMMESHESDEEILGILFSQGVGVYTDEELQTTKEEGKFNMIRAKQRRDQIFYMNDVTRYAIIRELLLGEGGFLMVERQKKWLLDYLWTRFISKSETENSELSSTVREILKTTLEQADPDIAFFMLAPFLHEKAFRPPGVSTSWQKVIEKNSGDYTKKKKNIFLEAAQDIQENKFLSEEERLELEADALEKEQLNHFWDFNRIIPHIERIISSEGNATQSQTFEKISLERFIIKIAETLGAPGVRFLQILGQYVDLPQSLEKIFDDAYDNIKRQSKLTSMHTIEREWPTFAEDVKYLNERRGGGSLMTSYEAEMASGEKRIVKVLNANAILFVKQSMKVLRKVFTSLASKQPERYSVAMLALDEIETWILEDIEYNTFIAFDKQFHATHNGKQYPGHEYGVVIPKSQSISVEGTDNMYVKVEEFVEGETLVRADLSEQERKDIASTLVKNYFEQMMLPVSIEDPHSGEQRTVSLVHADVHPGNFMVGQKEGKKFVAVIDRNNFIELDENDRNFLQGLLFGDESTRIDTLLDYILPLTLVVDRNTMKEKLESILSHPKDISKTVTEVLLECKRLRVKLPLKLTLLAKNLHGLQKICTQAGFRSMVDAFQYSPT